MLMDMIATLAAGAALCCAALIARHLSGGRLPKWLLPASFGLGMLLFSVWNEYTWHDRATDALPPEVIILTSPADRVPYRPWTYIFPVSTRFAALDRRVLQRSETNPDLLRVDAMVVQRWSPTVRIPLAFDCAAGRRAELIEGATLAPDGTLTGADWLTVHPVDELQRAACQEG